MNFSSQKPALLRVFDCISDWKFYCLVKVSAMLVEMVLPELVVSEVLVDNVKVFPLVVKVYNEPPTFAADKTDEPSPVKITALLAVELLRYSPCTTGRRCNRRGGAFRISFIYGISAITVKCP